MKSSDRRSYDLLSGMLNDREPKPKSNKILVLGDEYKKKKEIELCFDGNDLWTALHSNTYIPEKDAPSDLWTTAHLEQDVVTKKKGILGEAINSIEKTTVQGSEKCIKSDSNTSDRGRITEVAVTRYYNLYQAILAGKDIKMRVGTPTQMIQLQYVCIAAGAIWCVKNSEPRHLNARYLFVSKYGKRHYIGVLDETVPDIEDRFKVCMHIEYLPYTNVLLAQE